MARRFNAPKDEADAKRRFEIKRKQYEKLIHDVALGDNEIEDERKLTEKRWSVRDEMDDLTRFMSDDSTERERLADKVRALSHRYEEAREKGYHARQERRNKEIARLHEESRIDPHSYEGELRRMRGR